jgi:hypothetical protein
MATRLRKLQINEVSLCDSGANPGAFITLFKRDIPTDEIEVPEEFDDPKFDASGKGPMHDRLWTLYDDNRRSSNYAQPAFQAAWADLTPDEKQQVRNEEAAHEAALAAQAAAKQKESQRMSDTEILIKSAHAIAAGDFANDVLSASRWHGELRKYAADRQQPGETVEQAYARLVKSDPDARALFRASLGGVADDVPAPAPAPAPVVKSDSPLGRFRKIVDDYVEAQPGLSRLTAMEKAIASHPDAWAAAKSKSAFA